MSRGTGTKKGVKAARNFIIVLSDFSSVVLETAQWFKCHLLCGAMCYSGPVKLHFEKKRKSTIATILRSRSRVFMGTSAFHVGFNATAAALPHWSCFIPHEVDKGSQMSSEQADRNHWLSAGGVFSSFTHSMQYSHVLFMPSGLGFPPVPRL